MTDVREIRRSLDACRKSQRALLDKLNAAESALASARAAGAAEERERLLPLLVVARDRIHASIAFVGSVVDECDQHEAADEVICRNADFIRATDALDQTDRSHERWELDAVARLAALAGEERK